MTLQRTCLMLGVALAAASGLALEVVLTRLFSVLLGHHHAVLAVSLGLFGAALGGVLVYVIPSIARPPRLFSSLAYLAGAASATTFGALIFLMGMQHIKPEIGPSLGRLGLLYLVCGLPFGAIGAVLAASLRHAPHHVGRVYAADLLGAAVGAIASVPLLELGAPRAAMVLSIVLAVACVLFAVGSTQTSGVVSARERPAQASVVSAFILAAGCLLLGDLGDPWANMPSTSTLNMRRVEYSTWSVLSFVTVDRPVRGMAWIRTDGRGTSAILEGKTEVTRHPDEMAYELHGAEGPVLIVGPGGGREVRAALEAGQTDVVGAEVDAAIVDDVMLGRYKEFSGGLYARDGVRVVVADGRAYARASDRPYRSIVLSLVDTAAAGPAEPLTLSENGLYTVEGITDFLGALSDEGTLVINRWDKEFERLLGLSAAGLRRFGVADPASHIFACSHSRSTSVLVKRTPLLEEEIGKLRKYCRDRHYREMFAPDRQGTDRAAALAAGMGLGAAAATEPDLTPPTDDRPFFFYLVNAERLPLLLSDLGALAREHPDLWTVVALLLASGAVAVFVLVVPLLARPRVLFGAAGRGRLLSSLAYFAAIGFGFAVVEVVLVSRLGVFLGHPAYALTVAVSTLLVAGGVGSLLAERVRTGSAEGLGSRVGQALVVVLILMAVGLGPVLDAARGFPFAGRVVVALVVCGVPGVLMGTQLPLGVRLVAARSEEAVPWCLAVSGVSAVVASALAMFVALHYGFAVLLLFAGLAYFLASIFLPPAPPRGAGAEEAAAPPPLEGRAELP